MKAVLAAVENVTRRIIQSAGLPWLVLAIGVPASICLALLIQNSVERVARLRFEREANSANSIIDDRLRSYSDVLYALRALFATDEPIDRRRFHFFVESLDLKHRYPGFISLNYATYVPAHDKHQFEESVRRDASLNGSGYPDFAIKPPGERPEYYVLVYLEPMAGYEFALGLDIGANPMAANPDKVAEAVRQHRDTGDLSASAQQLRVKRAKDAIYLAMRLGVYRKGAELGSKEQRRGAYLGSVGAAFDVESLMREALDEEMLRHIRFKLYDAGPAAESGEALVPEAKRLLFDSEQLGKVPRTVTAKGSADSSFVHLLPVPVAGRIWNFEYSAEKHSVINDTDRLLPLAVLVSGLLSSFLLSALLYFLASSRRRAVQIASEITRTLRESESSLAEAQHIAHLGNWSLDPANSNMTWSEETFRIFGLEPRPGPLACADVLLRVHEDDRELLRQTIRRAIVSRHDCEIDYRILLDDGTVRWAHTIARPGRHLRQSPISGTVMDITERKVAEQELLENRALLNDAQKLSHVGCWQYTPQERRMVWSEEVYRIYGVEARTFEPSYETALNLVHPEDRLATGRAVDAAWQSGQGFTIDYRIVQPGGMVRYIRSLGEVVGSGRGRAATMLGSILDITDQKHAEDALRAYAEQLAGLSRRLVDVQESDRREFSRELHDRIGQNLTALSLNLDILKSQLAGDADAALRSRLDDSSALLESTAGSVENLLSELRPPMLDDYGLLSALQWYGNEFSVRTGIDVKVHGDENMKRLPPSAEIALFRIAQEALNNIVKHAHANIVDVALQHEGGQCVMSLADDGVGFESVPVASSRRRARLGMLTMRERAQTVGGQFEVSAVPGGGTRVSVRVPY